MDHVRNLFCRRPRTQEQGKGLFRRALVGKSANGRDHLCGLDVARELGAPFHCIDLHLDEDEEFRGFNDDIDPVPVAAERPFFRLNPDRWPDTAAPVGRAALR